MNDLERYLISDSSSFKKSASVGGLSDLTPSVPILPPSLQEISKTPVDKAKEIDLWTKWKNSNYDPTYLRPLQEGMKGLIKINVDKWARVNIPRMAIEMEAEKHFIEALKDYDPTKGASLSTHISQRLNRIERFVLSHQNLARIPENRGGAKFGEYKTARTLYRDEYGRDPTPQELAEKMSLEYKRPVTPKEVSMYMKEDRRDLGITDDSDFRHEATGDRILLKMLPYELNIEEKQVFERYFGLNGSKQMQPGEIAKELNINPSKVSRLIASIRTKWEKYQ
jgi:DNA-directed RNA polymerase specialized sigma subunit